MCSDRTMTTERCKNTSDIFIRPIYLKKIVRSIVVAVLREELGGLTFGVEHDSDVAARALGNRLAQAIEAGVVGGVVAVGEVESGDIHTRIDQLAEAYHNK
jgi:hypothetical protein